MLGMEGEKTTHFEVLSDFTDETLEGQLADEELRRLLVATDFTERDRTRPEAMGFLQAWWSAQGHAARDEATHLDTTSGSSRRLGGFLGGELLARRLATSRLAGSLLYAGNKHESH